MEMGEGILFIISGPAGSGKTTLARTVVERYMDIRFAVSYTTRKQRPREVDGVDYRFVTEQEFEDMVHKNLFAEWAVVHGHRYGTPVAELDQAKSSGVDLFLDLDVQGTAKLKKQYGTGVYIFVRPSSLDVLRSRLVKRQSDDPAEIEKRLENAKREMEQVHYYDYIIINDSLDEAIENLDAVIKAERCKKDRVLRRLERKEDA